MSSIHIVFLTVGAVLLSLPDHSACAEFTAHCEVWWQDQAAASVGAGCRPVNRSSSRARQRQTIAENFALMASARPMSSRYGKGFADATADVDTAVSVVRDISITLKLAGGHETVNVQGSLRDYDERWIRRAPCVRVVDSKDSKRFAPARSFAISLISYRELSRSSIRPYQRRITAVSPAKLRLEQRTVG